MTRQILKDRVIYYPMSFFDSHSSCRVVLMRSSPRRPLHSRVSKRDTKRFLTVRFDSLAHPYVSSLRWLSRPLSLSLSLSVSFSRSLFLFSQTVSSPACFRVSFADYRKTDDDESI